MSHLDFLKDLNDIDEKMIREAAPGGTGMPDRKISRTRILRIAGLTAAALLLAVGTGIWMRNRGRENPSAERTKAVQQDTSLTQETLSSELPADTEEHTTEAGTAAPISGQNGTETALIPPETEAAEQDILYQSDDITVYRITESLKTAMQGEYQLAYLTERELFEKCDVLLRAKVTDITNISITDSRFAYPSEACILTLEPLEIIRGTLKKEGPVKVYVNRYIHTSLEGMNLSLRSAQAGQEGIVMLYEIRYAADYVKALADYSVGDSERFAIWQNKSGGLVFSQYGFTGISKSWDLDLAESYIRSLLSDNEPAPADFAVFFRHEYRGRVPEDNSCYSFDSGSGLYSTAGTYYWEKEAGPENCTAVIVPDQDTMNKLWQTCKRLQDFAAEPSSEPPADGSEGLYIEIRYRANGTETAAHVWSSGDEPNPLLGIITELHHYLNACEAMRAWDEQLAEIVAERRLEQSKKIAEALTAAFDAKYGPGGTPDYYLGMEFVAGGWLQIRLKSADGTQLGQWVEEIISLLPGFEDGYLFASGEEPGT